jgi:lipopolysaccharide transport protein LptA
MRKYPTSKTMQPAESPTRSSGLRGVHFAWAGTFLVLAMIGAFWAMTDRSDAKPSPEPAARESKKPAKTEEKSAEEASAKADATPESAKTAEEPQQPANEDEAAKPDADAPKPSPTKKEGDSAAGGILGGGGGETTIYADKQADFDSKAKKAIFLGNVRVKDAEFYITCDKLTVYVDEAEGGLKTADAEGNVRVVQQKTDADGGKQISTGKGRKLLYNAKTGEARLTGRPQVQQGINLHLADNDSTTMILRRDGTLETLGSSRTVINPEAGADGTEKQTPE